MAPVILPCYLLTTCAEEMPAALATVKPQAARNLRILRRRFMILSIPLRILVVKTQYTSPHWVT